MGKILRRCSVCGKFHASYLVPEHFGRPGYLCRTCWNALYAPAARRPDKTEPTQQTTEAPSAQQVSKP